MNKDFHFYEPRNGHGLQHDPFNSIVAKLWGHPLAARCQQGARIFFNAHQRIKVSLLTH
jgi:hypothetical protein